MSQAAKANEPTMEEILASIRKIISDDDTAKPAEPAPAAKKAEPPPAAEAAPQSQDDIDALMASFDAVEEEPEPPPPPPAPKAKAAPPLPNAPEPETDIFELTEAVSVPLPKVNDDLDFADVVEEPPPPPPPVAKAPPKPAPAPQPSWDEEPLMSGDAQKAVGAAFSSLGALTLSHGGTLDGLVREMLRPMLKQWLDEQLPPLVEKLVRAEIERAARGGR